MSDYNQITPEIIAQMEKIVPGRVCTGEDVNPDYSRDEMPIYGKRMPEVAIDVLTTEEIAGIMKICYDNNIPVTCRGAGTGLVGAATPIAGGVVLCTMKMNQILEYDLDNFVVKVQPGVLLSDLHEDAASHGLLYPPDPGEKFATLGGNVATNAGGMKAVKYGCTREYVRSMKVVLPTGEVIKIGNAVSKTSSGYSLLNLMIGSEGTLGIITELTLKLIPIPKEAISLVIPYEDLNTCISTVPLFKKNHMNPQALEFFEKEILISSEEYLGKSEFPRNVNGTDVAAYLLVTFDGDNEDEVYAIVEKAAEMVAESGAMDVLIADTPAKMASAWAARSSFLEGVEEQTKLLDECDVVVPSSKIAEFVEYYKKVGEGYDFEIKCFGHAGDGNLHIYMCSNDMEIDEFKKQCHEFLTQIYDKATEMDGLISGEHGIGMGKISYLERTIGQTNVRLMQGIKKVFDEKMILNPGKVCYKL